MPVLPPKNPLTSGKKRVWAIYVPEALLAEIERNAAIDGFDKVSPYAVHLLVAGLEKLKQEREAERLEQEKAKHK